MPSIGSNRTMGAIRGFDMDTSTHGENRTSPSGARTPASLRWMARLTASPPPAESPARTALPGASRTWPMRTPRGANASAAVYSGARG